MGCKSSSSWAFKNKWKYGFRSLLEDDTFGYIGQLYGYSKGQNKEMGGWIVADKSSGEILFVEAEPEPHHLKEIHQSISNTIHKVSNDAPFERCFEDEVEYFNRKPTGSKRLHKTCTFCDYKHTCWGDIQYKPQTKSKAQNPRHYWYTEYNDETN